MSELEGFSSENGRAIYRPSGWVSFGRLVSLVHAAIAATRAGQSRALLVDTTGVFGFDPPNTFERFFAVTDWAIEGQGITMAMVARAEMIDSEKFGVTVGRNRGFTCDIFLTEAEARAWLDAHVSN